MIQLLRWVLTSKQPAFYDSESVTSIEMVAKLYGAMQTLIDEYNTFAAETEKKLNDFMADINADQEVFQIGIRQEFQDFIDVIDLNMQEQDVKIANAEGFMQKNITATTQNVVNDAIKNGSIKVTEVYDPNTESLNMNVSGGV